MKLRRRPLRKARIEIIPMIDTVFFLLVFFVMASLAMTARGGIPVNLPRAARAEAARVLVSVSISREGVVYLEREPVEPAQLTARLQARARTEPELAVVIEADTDVRHGRV
ncbi:MAG TPA: biopolymer transporter ExbD, partial [Methylomirabilota bacterium]|nr:biopolymer transporter ExbD [Methylomirabilota bacterium]